MDWTTEFIKKKWKEERGVSKDFCKLCEAFTDDDKDDKCRDWFEHGWSNPGAKAGFLKLPDDIQRDFINISRKLCEPLCHIVCRVTDEDDLWFQKLVK